MFFVLKSPSGQAAIMQLCEGANIEAEVMKFASTNWMPDSVTPIDPASIPSDRSTRNAWMLDGGNIALKPA